MTCRCGLVVSDTSIVDGNNAVKIRVFALIFCFALTALAKAEPPPLEAYGHLPEMELVKLSPSGERCAFIAVVGESRRLIVVSDQGKPLLSMKTGDIKVRNLEWVGEDRILIWSTTTYDRFQELDGVYEFTSVANVDLKAHTVSNIFAKDKNVAHFVFGYAGSAHVDGHDYAYFVGITFAFNHLQNFYEFAGDHRDLYRVDLATNDKERIAHSGDGPGYSWVIGRDGAVLAHSTYDQVKGIWRLYAGADNDKLLLEKSAPFGDIDLVGRGRTPHTVLVSDDSSGAEATREISVPDGKASTLFTDVNIDGYLDDPDTGQAIGATTLEEPRAVFFDPKLEARIKGTRKAFPGLQMHLVSFSRNLDRLVVKTDGGNDSGTYWKVNIASGSADPLGYPYPEIHAADVAPTQWINYKASDGLDIGAVLTLPRGHKAEKLPLVVLPHGGPIGVSDEVGFDWWAQAYASRGYAVLQPNFRGSGGGGEKLVSAGYGELGRKMQTDLSDGVAALAAQGIIDPQRVCIVGASYGGYAALVGVTLQHGIYRCAVSVSGPSNLPAFFQWERNKHGRKSDITRFWRALTGAETEGNSVMDAISPAYFADKVSVPVLLIHGKDDTVVPIAQSELMASALRSAHKSVEFVKMDGEDHWLSRAETREKMLKDSVAFVLKYNPPD